MQQETSTRVATTPPAVPRPREGGGSGGRTRDPYFDNAKYLTIVLVACGHAWEPLTYGSRAATAIYLLVYAFHMPAFALISGYFSRSFDMAPGRTFVPLTRYLGGLHAYKQIMPPRPPGGRDEPLEQRVHEGYEWLMCSRGGYGWRWASTIWCSCPVRQPNSTPVRPMASPTPGTSRWSSSPCSGRRASASMSAPALPVPDPPRPTPGALTPRARPGRAARDAHFPVCGFPCRPVPDSSVSGTSSRIQLLAGAHHVQVVGSVLRLLIGEVPGDPAPVLALLVFLRSPVVAHDAAPFVDSSMEGAQRGDYP
ncbi:hypothetical protein SANTM175S_10427 [Streptomyces antimycoticus]